MEQARSPKPPSAKLESTHLENKSPAGDETSPAEPGELEPNTLARVVLLIGYVDKREFRIPASGTLFDDGYRIMEHELQGPGIDLD